MDQREIAVRAAKALDAKRAKDIIVLKVDEMTVITDYMVIATGRSVPQVKALCDEVEEKSAELGLEVRRTEGYPEGRWIVVDFGSILVHIFYPEEREYYNMERLWVDDPRDFVDYSKLMLDNEREKQEEIKRAQVE